MTPVDFVDSFYLQKSVGVESVGIVQMDLFFDFLVVFQSGFEENFALEFGQFKVVEKFEVEVNQHFGHFFTTFSAFHESHKTVTFLFFSFFCRFFFLKNWTGSSA